jgi:hypothetical protein
VRANVLKRVDIPLQREPNTGATVATRMKASTRGDLAITIAAIAGGLILSQLTNAQREAAAPPEADEDWASWWKWGAPVAMTVASFVSIWGEVHEPARKEDPRDKALRRMISVSSSMLGVVTAAFARGPALRPAQAMTLMQSAVGYVKDAGGDARGRRDMRVVSILPLAAWAGYALGFQAKLLSTAEPDGARRYLKLNR